jgi:hypothetical protein
MTPNANSPVERTLVMRTLRTVAVLVAACVLFVGALSLVAVAVTSRALGAGEGARSTESAPSAKKPLSI